MKSVMQTAALGLILNLVGCATSQTFENASYTKTQNSYGDIGLVVNDGYVYQDLYYQSTTHLMVKSEFEKSGLFSRVVLNSPYIPRQVRMNIGRQNKGSDAATYGKLLVGAATLFLVPTQNDEIYVGHFSLECAGTELMKMTYEQEVTKTSFIGVDPSSYTQKVVESFVSKFLADAQNGGNLVSACISGDSQSEKLDQSDDTISGEKL